MAGWGGNTACEYWRPLHLAQRVYVLHVLGLVRVHVSASCTRT